MEITILSDDNEGQNLGHVESLPLTQDVQQSYIAVLLIVAQEARGACRLDFS